MANRSDRDPLNLNLVLSVELGRQMRCGSADSIRASRTKPCTNRPDIKLQPARQTCQTCQIGLAIGRRPYKQDETGSHLDRRAIAHAMRASVPRSPALRASPFAAGPKASSNWIFCRLARMSVSSYWPCPSFRPSPASRLLCLLLTSAPRSRPLRNRSVRGFRTRRRPPEVRPTAFTAHPPDLPPRPLMALDFAIIGTLVRPGRPRIRFLSIGSRLCSTLPSDPASRRRPCASLILRRHRAG